MFGPKKSRSSSSKDKTGKKSSSNKHKKDKGKQKSSRREARGENDNDNELEILQPTGTELPIPAKPKPDPVPPPRPSKVDPPEEMDDNDESGGEDSAQSEFGDAPYYSDNNDTPEYGAQPVGSAISQRSYTPTTELSLSTYSTASYSSYGTSSNLTPPQLQSYPQHFAKNALTRFGSDHRTGSPGLYDQEEEEEEGRDGGEEDYRSREEYSQDRSATFQDDTQYRNSQGSSYYPRSSDVTWAGVPTQTHTVQPSYSYSVYEKEGRNRYK